MGVNTGDSHPAHLCVSFVIYRNGLSTPFLTPAINRVIVNTL